MQTRPLGVIFRSVAIPAAPASFVIVCSLAQPLPRRGVRYRAHFQIHLSRRFRCYRWPCDSAGSSTGNPSPVETYARNYSPGQYIGSGLAPHRLGRMSLPDRSCHKPADVYYPVSRLRRPLGGIVMQAVLRSVDRCRPPLTRRSGSGLGPVGGHACRHEGNRSA